MTKHYCLYKRLDMPPPLIPTLTVQNVKRTNLHQFKQSRHDICGKHGHQINTLAIFHYHTEDEQ